MGTELGKLWLTLCVLILGGALAVFCRALRAGLFRDQQRARSLALWAALEEPMGEEKEEEVLRRQTEMRKWGQGS